MAKAATKKTTAKKTTAKKTTAKTTTAKKPTAKKTTKAKTKTAPEKVVAANEQEAQTAGEAKAGAVSTRNLLDMENIDVKRLIAKAKKSGLLATSELNKHINLDNITPDEIEVTLAQLSDLGILSLIHI